jgi:hypothetical protein
MQLSKLLVYRVATNLIVLFIFSERVLADTCNADRWQQKNKLKTG